MPLQAVDVFQAIQHKDVVALKGQIDECGNLIDIEPGVPKFIDALLCQVMQSGNREDKHTLTLAMLIANGLRTENNNVYNPEGMITPILNSMQTPLFSGDAERAEFNRKLDTDCRIDDCHAHLMKSSENLLRAAVSGVKVLELDDTNITVMNRFRYDQMAKNESGEYMFDRDLEAGISTSPGR